LIHILHCLLGIGTLSILNEGKRVFTLVEADLDMFDLSVPIKFFTYFVFIDGLW